MKTKSICPAVILVLTANCFPARLLLILLMAGGLPIFCPAQFTTLWTQRNNLGGIDDKVKAITADASGIYITGWDVSTGANQWRIEKRNLTTGTLDVAFGTGGAITSNPGGGTEYAEAIAVDATGIYVAGYDNVTVNPRWRIEKRDLTTGAFDAAFGTAGVVTTDPSGGYDGAYAIKSDGSYIYVAGFDNSPGNYQWRVEKRDCSTGALDAAFGTGGVITSDPSGGNDLPQAMVLGNAAIFVAGWDEILGAGNRQWRIEKYNKLTGALLGTFGTAGVITNNLSAGDDYVTSITTDGSAIYVAGYDYSPGNYQWRIEKRSLTGILDPVFGGGTGVVTSNPSGWWNLANAITTDASAIYVAGVDKSPGNYEWRIEKRDLSTGALLCTQTSNPSTSEDLAYAITADASGIYVAGYDDISGGVNYEWHIEKYNGVCTILPVELLYFNAFPEDNNLVRCKWSTATEINNDYFAVQRSKDGIVFEQIGTVQGSGNSSTTLYYVFYDHEPYSGISYYRLKQFDYNGQYEYSSIRQVYIGTFNIITIYPNPSSEYIHYTIASEDGGTVTVKVMDVLGREIISTEEMIEGGVTTKKLNTANLSSGSYLLRITNGKQEKVQKQFVVK